MNYWIVFIFLNISQTLLAASDGLNLEDFDASEREQFITCKKTYFFEDGCQRILNKACSIGNNRNQWICLKREFDTCKPSNFSGSRCQSTLRKVCSDTEGKYDFACDRYKYEECLKNDFEGISCKENRREFAIAKLEDEIQALAGQRPREIVDVGGRVRDLKEADFEKAKASFCRKQDYTHELYAQYCESSISYDWDTFLDYLNKIEDGVTSITDRNGRRFDLPDRKTLYEGLLNSPPKKDQWESLLAQDHWYWEEDETRNYRTSQHKERRILSAKILDQFSDDSIFSTYYLLEAANDDLMEVKRAGIKGLSERRYESGLVIATLVKGLSSRDKLTRIYSLNGLARRWNYQLQSAAYDHRVQDTLGYLLDCEGILADPGLYDRIRTLDDINNLDLGSSQVLCSFGVGARLYHLKEKIYQIYIDTLLNTTKSSDERIAALDGLELMSNASPTSKKTAIDSAMKSLQQNVDVNLASAATSMVLKFIDFDDEDMKTKVFKSIVPIINQYFDNIEEHTIKTKGTFSNLDPLLAEMSEYDLLSRFVPERNGYKLLLNRCLKNNNVPNLLKLKCFSGMQITAESIEEVFPVLVQEINDASSFASIKLTLKLLSSRHYSFLDFDETLDNCSKRLKISEVISKQILNIFDNDLVFVWNLFGDFFSTYRRLTVDTDGYGESCQLNAVHKKFLKKLKKEERISKLDSMMNKMYPSIPLVAWFARFDQTKKDIIEKFEFRERSRVIVSYNIRDEYSKVLKEKLNDRSINEFLIYIHAWYDFKSLYSFIKFSTLPMDEGQIAKNLWGIYKPSNDQ